MPASKKTRERQLAKLAEKRAAERRKKHTQRVAAISVAAVVGVAGIALLGFTFLGGGSSPTPTPSATPSTSPAPAASPVTVTSDDGKVSCTYVPNPSDQTNGRDKGIPDLIIDPDFGYATTITTSMGVIEADLFVDQAPCTVNSWNFLAQKGFFDGLTFHRVAQNPPVIQGGDPAGQGFGGPGYTFADELDNDLQYERGTLAMANSGPNTNGSQFFIMTDDYQFPKSYTIFGKVTKGMDVVDKIHAVQTDAQERPVEPVTITSVTIIVKPLGEPTPSGSGSASPSGSPASTPPESTEPSASPTST